MEMNMEKVEILTPEQLEKQTDARLDAYLEQVKNYMALDMPSDQLGTYKELVQSIMAEKESRKNRNVPEDNPDGWESPAGTENTAGGFDMNYIDTSYELEQSKADPKDRGVVSLTCSLIFTCALAGFTGMYFYMIASGRAAAFERLGGLYPDKKLVLWAVLTAAGLVFNLTAMFSKSAKIPAAALICYLAAAVCMLLVLKMPVYYLALNAVPALLCLIGAVRKAAA